MSSPIYKVKLDIQHVRRKFHIYCHSGDTPIIRAWLYEDGVKYYPAEDWTAKLGFGEDYEYSTALVIVDGVAGYALDSSSSSEDEDDVGYGDTDYNYFEFDFITEDIATPGDYFCQILVKNADDTERYVFGDGTIHILPSPIGGTYSSLVLTEVVNWDTIENLGATPWADSTEVIEADSCALTSTDCSIDDTGKTWIWSGACDQTFMLPAASADHIGAIFKFLNLTTNKITVRAQPGDLIDGYPAIYTGQGGVNDNPAYTYINIKQTTATGYNATTGRLKWTYLTV